MRHSTHGCIRSSVRFSGFLFRRSVITVATLLALSVTSGCGFHSEPLVTGSVGGAAAGAGTGAIVGAVIANGDVGASALLGGAIGIPVGLAVGAIYDYNSEQSVRERKRDAIAETQKELYSRQREIDVLRESIRTEGPTGNPSEELKEYQYTGPTLGDYYR